jgi:hypothetical protein
MLQGKWCSQVHTQHREQQVVVVVVVGVVGVVGVVVVVVVVVFHLPVSLAKTPQVDELLVVEELIHQELHANLKQSLNQTKSTQRMHECIKQATIT